MGAITDQPLNAAINVGGSLLQGLLIELEEDFHRSCDSRGLNLAPQPAFIAADAVHDHRNISEVMLEFLLQDLRIVVSEVAPTGSPCLTLASSPANISFSSNLPTRRATLMMFPRRSLV